MPALSLEFQGRAGTGHSRAWTRGTLGGDESHHGRECRVNASRGVVDGLLTPPELLEAKLARLNLKGEPFLTAAAVVRG